MENRLKDNLRHPVKWYREAKAHGEKTPIISSMMGYGVLGLEKIGGFHIR